jgi:hypothetical protein
MAVRRSDKCSTKPQQSEYHDIVITNANEVQYRQLIWENTEDVLVLVRDSWQW